MPQGQDEQEGREKSKRCTGEVDCTNKKTKKKCLLSCPVCVPFYN